LIFYWKFKKLVILKAQNDQALLTRLKDSGHEFVVIGGVCAVYHGAPLAIFDLDIGEENIQRIEFVVRDLCAFHHLTASKLRLEMAQSSFASLKNLHLRTDFWKLGCLSEVAGVGNYEEARKQSVVARLSCGEFRFLSIDALTAVKKAIGRERDLDAVRLLLAIKERKEQQKNLF
jgi:hypothetical protein